MSNYQKMHNLVITAIRYCLRKYSKLGEEFKDDLEGAFYVRYGTNVEVDLQKVVTFVGRRDVRWPRVQEELGHEILKHFYVHYGLDLNKREIQ